MSGEAGSDLMDGHEEASVSMIPPHRTIVLFEMLLIYSSLY